MSYHKLYAQVLQALPQAVCHCDEQGIICESNPAAQALLGYPPEVLQQMWWLELVHVSDQAHIEDAWHALQTQADVPPCTVRCLRGDSYKDSYKNLYRESYRDAYGGSDVFQGAQHAADLFAYVSVRVTFTATYDAAGKLEHVLLWLEHNPEMHAANHVSGAIDNAVAEDIADKDLASKDIASKDMTNKSGVNRQPLNRFERHAQVGNVQTLLSESSHETPVSYQQASDLQASDLQASDPQASDPQASDPQANQHVHNDWHNDRVIARDFYFDTRPAIIAVLDRQWRVVQVSEAAAAMIGQATAEVLGGTLWELLPKMQHNAAGQALRQAMQTGEPLYYEFVAEDERLPNAWHGVHIIPVEDHLVVKVENLTKRKATEQRLVAAKHRAEVLFEQRNAILESISDYFFILNRDYRFVYANQAVLELLEETSQSILNRTVWDTVVLPADNPFRKAYQKAINEQVSQRVRYRSSNPKLTGQTLEIALYPFQGGVIGYSRDVSESEALRQQLDQTLADKEAILNSIRDGVSVLTRDWLYVYANREVLERRPDILGKHYFSLFPEHRDSIFEHKYRHAFDTQQPVFFEAQTADGKWVEVRVYPAGDSITIYTAEVTARKQLEQDLRDTNRKLQASEAKFRAFFEVSTTPLFMYIVSEDGPGEGLFNQAFHDFLGDTAWSDHDHDSMSLAQAAEVVKAITHPDDVAHERHYMDEVLAGKCDGYRMEKRYRNRDGSVIWGDLNTVTVRAEDGSVRLNIAIVQDITQIKRTEQALKTSEARFRAFFENNTTPCTMYIFYDDGEWQQGFHFNDAFATFLKDTTFADYADRLSSVEDTLHALTAIGHPEDNALDEYYVGEVVAGVRDQYHLEKRYFTRDGAIIWGEISSVFLRDEQGKLTLGMAIIQDTTERKRAQAALERALADKDLLLKEVHHRTKNNMQLIASMLALQSRHIADNLAKEALVDSSKRINLLANMHRVLYQTSDNDSIDIGEQLSSLVTSLKLGFRADITINEDIINEDIAPVYLDVHQAIPLSLIANELLTNAFKHAFLEASSEDTLTVCLQQQAGTVTLEIKDNGVGLADDYPKDHLGMVIVESLAQQIDATFTLENAPEGGCLARVSFRQVHK